MNSRNILWLDDFRSPEDHITEYWDANVSVYWAKDMESFIKLYPYNRITEVWFDHDLQPSHYTPSEYWDNYAASAAYQELQNHRGTGYHCAVWLVEFCKNTKTKLPLFYSQSANPIGRDRILSLLNWEKENNFD